MYISQLEIEGYKNARKMSRINLNKGLNVLVGENGCGKTAIINSLRMLLKENESYFEFSEDDFYCSLDKTYFSTEINISATFSELSEDEKITFLTWCGSDFNAQLHLKINENNIRSGYFKRKYWGGHSSASIFEEDTFDRVECIYLPPLRDAESKLSNGKNSRLAYLLKKQYGDNTGALVDIVKKFNDNITQNENEEYTEIDTVRKSINSKIKESLGTELGQSINLQFSDTTFNKIIQNIRMVFFPEIDESDIFKFRDLATNSLGYNNLLYIATVFAELELIKDTDVFTLFLIEEPEAHLHPQLQVKFVQYLENLSNSLANAQIIVSTHSPVLASSVNIDNIIHISDRNSGIESITLQEKTFGDDLNKKYLDRWLDVTKSTMLFSRGIILVEGIAEALILPCFGKLVLQKYNELAYSNGKKVLASTLEEMGISVININGRDFKYFMKLFGNFDGSTGPNIPIYCAGLTDRDPEKNIYPLPNETIISTNPAGKYIDKINSDENIYSKLFMSPLKTFEYDIAFENPVKLASVLRNIWSAEDKSKGVAGELGIIASKNNTYDNDESKRTDIEYIYTHIEKSSVGKGLFAYELSEAIDENFVIPKYIENGILWSCGGIINDK